MMLRILDPSMGEVVDRDNDRTFVSLSRVVGYVTKRHANKITNMQPGYRLTRACGEKLVKIG